MRYCQECGKPIIKNKGDGKKYYKARKYCNQRCYMKFREIKLPREAGNFLISLKEHKNKNFSFSQILKQI